MKGSWLIGGMLVFTTIFAMALYYFQVYAWYEEVNDVTEVTAYGDAFPVSDYRGIDADTSPLKLRACFTVDWVFEPNRELAQIAEPLKAPGWFDCFDAGAITRDLRAGNAAAILAASQEPYGFDRYITQYEDGRAYMWRQLNECGTALYAGDPLPIDCPRPPEED